MFAPEKYLTFSVMGQWSMNSSSHTFSRSSLTGSWTPRLILTRFHHLQHPLDTSMRLSLIQHTHTHTYACVPAWMLSSPEGLLSSAFTSFFLICRASMLVVKLLIPLSGWADAQEQIPSFHFLLCALLSFPLALLSKYLFRCSPAASSSAFYFSTFSFPFLTPFLLPPPRLLNPLHLPLVLSLTSLLGFHTFI